MALTCVVESAEMHPFSASVFHDKMMAHSGNGPYINYHTFVGPVPRKCHPICTDSFWKRTIHKSLFPCSARSPNGLQPISAYTVPVRLGNEPYKGNGSTILLYGYSFHSLTIPFLTGLFTTYSATLINDSSLLIT